LNEQLMGTPTRVLSSVAGDGDMVVPWSLEDRYELKIRKRENQKRWN
jgi:hypothetical protein